MRSFILIALLVPSIAYAQDKPNTREIIIPARKNGSASTAGSVLRVPDLKNRPRTITTKKVAPVFVMSPYASSLHELRGQATSLDSGFELSSGSVLLNQKTANEFLKQCRRNNSFSLDVTFVPYQTEQTGPARIVSFSKNTNERNFTLGQEGNKLILRLRTTKQDPNGTNNQLTLGQIEMNQSYRVQINWNKGTLTTKVNAVTTTEKKLHGILTHWENFPLILGDELTEDRNWNGRITHLSLDTQ